MTFDLEKLVMEACEGVRTVHSEDVNECEARDVGNCSLRRKLFGQPDRQVCTRLQYTIILFCMLIFLLPS